MTAHFILDADFPDRLCARLRQPLPGRAAQRQFAHELSYGRHFWTETPHAVLAATAIILVRRDSLWQIPLTLRPHTLPSHAGQICLPGGRLEKGESLSAAALREVNEELRIPQTALQVLGRLSPLYLYATNFRVTPFVLVCSSDELTIFPNPDEVAELIWLPVPDLVDSSGNIRGSHLATANATVDVEFHAPHLAIDDYRVWGATAMMLGEFAAVIEPRLITGD